MTENQMLKEALLKIYEPMKYHHREEDPYTRAACFQYVAQQALKIAGVLDENYNVIKHPIQEF